MYKVGDRIPIIDDNSINKTKICTLKEIVYSCEFFNFWTFNEIGGFYEDVIKYVEKNKEDQQKKYQIYRKEWSEKLKELTKDDEEMINIRNLINNLQKK